MNPETPQPRRITFNQYFSKPDNELEKKVEQLIQETGDVLDPGFELSDYNLLSSRMRTAEYIGRRIHMTEDRTKVNALYRGIVFGLQALDVIFDGEHAFSAAKLREYADQPDPFDEYNDDICSYAAKNEGVREFIKKYSYQLDQNAGMRLFVEQACAMTFMLSDSGKE